MEIVVGLSLTNRKPYVWQPASPYFIPSIRSIMVSYAEIGTKKGSRNKIMQQGLRAYLEVPDNIAIYLDNGSFSFWRKSLQVSQLEYLEFVDKAQPDWYAIPQDYIPAPAMSDSEQYVCLTQTMKMNKAYSYDGFVPVMHVCRSIQTYIDLFQAEANLKKKSHIALGGIVPNLLRAPKAMAYQDVLKSLQNVRQAFHDKSIHVFGVGGTATVHLTALLKMDSVDSTGWRNRAARGIIQLPGKGDRLITQLGNWRGRSLSDLEQKILKSCQCPACRLYGTKGLMANKVFGFSNRATHNLWVLLEEAKLVNTHIENNTYTEWYSSHLDNTIYKPLIDYLIKNANNGLK